MVRRQNFALWLALSSLAACSREAPSCTGCGTAIVVMAADADQLLPPLVSTAPGAYVSDLIFLKLADIGFDLNTIGDAGFQPRLARSWKFEDSLTIAFELDPRARWQDGPPVTAADVAFTFDIYRDPKVNALARGLLENIASVTARDERTAVFKFRRPNPEQFYDATYQMRILPRHLLDSIPRDKLGSHAFTRAPIGAGPYRLATWKAREMIDLTADSTFFLGRPGISRVIFQVTGDVNTALTQIIANQADLLDYIGGPDAVARMANVPQFRVETRPSAVYVFVAFNIHDPKAPSRPHPLFADRELRRALVEGTDRKTFVQALLGDYARVPVGPISRLTPMGNDSTIAQIPYDTAHARATLEQLGWRVGSDGIRARAGRRLAFDLLVPSSSGGRMRGAQILKEQLRLLGVDVGIKPLEFNIFNDRMHARNFDAVFSNWNEDPSPSSIRQVWISGAIRESNFGGYSNPQFDRLIDEAVQSRDTAAAHKKWREAYGVINNDAPGVWLYAPLQPTAIHRRYENVSIQRDQWLTSLWQWRVAPGQMIDRDRLGALPPASAPAPQKSP